MNLIFLYIREHFEKKKDTEKVKFFQKNSLGKKKCA
jgi:hypothetical protein